MKRISLLKIIDCTIRDGGHLNKWKFSIDSVKAAYYAAVKSGVDYFEIGYRFPDSSKDLGEFGYCEDDFIAQLFQPTENCKLLVMVDAGKYEPGLFKKRDPVKTPFSGVRVATYPDQIPRALEIAEILKGEGYEVYINLMAASELEDRHYDMLKAWKGKQVLNAIYFADSFGSFLPDDLPKYFTRLREIGFENIGYHAHNNLQLAFANTLKAIEMGAVSVDASIYGMGRGGGNLPVEVLIGFLEKQNAKRYNTMAYLDVIDRYFLQYAQQLKWGYNVQSFLSGLKNIHPYYVEELFHKNNYTPEEIWNVLDDLAEKCPTSFSMAKMNETLETRFYIPLSGERASMIFQEIKDEYRIYPAEDAFPADPSRFKGIHQGKTIMILANGPSIVKYKDSINKLIKDRQAITIGVNYLQGNYVPDYHLFISRKRFQKYSCQVDKRSTLVVPSFFGKCFVNEHYTGPYFTIDMQIIDNEKLPPIDREVQQMVHLNVGVSAILLAFTMGAKEVLIAGMDGYGSESNKQLVYFYNENDIQDNREVASLRYEKFSQELTRINKFLLEKGVSLSIITPTSHKKYFHQVFEL